MEYTEAVLVDHRQIERVAQLLAGTIPAEMESVEHTFVWTRTQDALANAYLAIVAICHQTSPIGERRLEGRVGGNLRYGWDYLKERFLVSANADDRWCEPSFWARLKPSDLSILYADEEYGLTLNRVSERAGLLNELGERLARDGFAWVHEAFGSCGWSFGGNGNGFLQYLAQFQAYSDPVRKKSLFFASIAVNECGWLAAETEPLSSPVDYHEIRGHLRLGTVKVMDPRLRQKVRGFLSLSKDEDVLLRRAIQSANEQLAAITGTSSSAVHYLLWNVFRNCCPRESSLTHCAACSVACGLPERYKTMPTYQGRCVFSPMCEAASMIEKVVEPPYVGHYY